MPPKRTDANKGWSEDEDPLPAKRLKIRPAEEPASADRAPLDIDRSVFYGRFIVLGYNDVPVDDKGNIVAQKDRNVVFEMYKRKQPNGVKFTRSAGGSLVPRSITSHERHMTLSLADVTRTATSVRIASRSDGRNSNDEIYEYTMEDDPETDLFQIGRDPTNNDFRIIGKGTGEQTTSVSRLAFRILCNRTDPTDIRIYAAGFDGNKEVFLGQNALRWNKPSPDGFITYGLNLWRPSAHGSSEGQWREISVLGDAYYPRSSRTRRGNKDSNSSNLLTDGCIITNANFCLLFRTTPADADESISPDHLESHLRSLAPRLRDPITFDSIPLTRAMDSVAYNRAVDPLPARGRQRNETDEKRAPYIFTKCGHVFSGYARLPTCAMCRTEGPFVPLILQTALGGLLKSFPTHVLPCGHGVDSEGATMWGEWDAPIAQPDWFAVGRTGSRLCPFCGTTWEISDGNGVQKIWWPEAEADE